MTKAHMRLSEVLGGERPDWDALKAFCSRLGPDSSLWQETHRKRADRELSAWMSRAKTNAMLADLYDSVSWLAYAVARQGGGKPKRPKPYPRPLSKSRGERVIGSSPVKVSEFEGWWSSGESKGGDSQWRT